MNHQSQVDDLGWWESISKAELEEQKRVLPFLISINYPLELKHKIRVIDYLLIFNFKEILDPFSSYLNLSILNIKLIAFHDSVYGMRNTRHQEASD